MIHNSMSNFRNPFPVGYNNIFNNNLSLTPFSVRPSYYAADVCNSPLVVPFVPLCGIKINVQQRSLSKDGLWFIYGHEAMPGVSNHLYWPRGSSGVTLGAGYDMKDRSGSDIISDMKFIGLADATAKVLSQASGLTDQEAKKFAHDHKMDVDLTDVQQVSLLSKTVKHYVESVRTAITIPLAQCEFDALVSFSYNSAGRWHSVTHYLNIGSVAAAMREIRAGNRSAGVVVPALTRRREDEVELYLTGKYIKR